MSGTQGNRRSIISATVDFDAPGKQLGVLRVPHSVHRSAYGHIAIPIAVIKNGKGPTVLLTGGVHGDEYEGPIALSKLVRKLNTTDVAGTIIVIPALNYPAFMAASRVSPIDSINLNRAFPGNRDGTVTEMIAHYVTTELLPRAAYLFDFHAGGSSLHYLPSLLVPFYGQGDDSAEIDRLVEAFAPPRVIRYDAEKALSGEDRVISNYARQLGVKFLTGEFGGGSSVNIEGLRAVEGGVLRYLDASGVLQLNEQLHRESCRTARSDRPQSYTMDDPGLFAFANGPGFFEPAFQLGETLEDGAVAGHIYSNVRPWDEPETIRFRTGGLAICIRTFAQVKAGDCLGHLARPV
ncbi:succinylglutamate desuccinylase [Paraburkholderia sp. Ac-20340]|uniref:succinylglutamate desuccinylase/aspartoacylase family protein n=1 Tax=Paraburkholderia sp. Ac-20340 TaxID=2703888 RepID=UPI0019816371|nr:succinylglutamate desuccinylase/aspartoacylase family protein [Paraburkholderia sp. Ac-20340]MBN3856716.1 succinylglutamate desuccinylase [Paraburkholderia sp. Ac-20340]